tara:strand:- start:7639 stop:8247 length:609 start_codon:yes stop_codon:yes gene_type:complete
MTVNLNCVTVNPFGPTILKVSVPTNIVQKINDFADTQEDKENMEHRLVSRIKDVPSLTNEVMESLDIKRMFIETGAHYVETITGKGNANVTIQSAWINNQIEDEYNPVHYHHDCKLSAVLYLKIPDNKDRGFFNDIDGHIDFMYGTADINELYPGNFCYKPTVGDMLVFPSTLSHTVYPFKGEGLRRTIAFNLNYTFTEEQK